MTAAIQCRSISKTYSHYALQEVDLSVAEGSVMGFVGPNGAGKSTTMRIIMGLLGYESGSVEVLGYPHAGKTGRCKFVRAIR